MTDTRIPEQWLTSPTINGLSDRAFRTFVNSMIYGNMHGTDGRLPPQAMRWAYVEGVDSETREELYRAELWVVDGADVVIPEWDGRMGQELAEVVQKRRDDNRDRKRAERERRAKVTRDKSRDVTPPVTRSRVGQEQEQMTGQEQDQEQASSGGVEEAVSWPVAKIPGARKAGAA